MNEKSIHREVVLVDLSSLAHPIWHTSQSDPDPNAASIKVVARVRALTADKPFCAICCDSGRSFRRDIAATYKANRPERDGTLQHQIILACEQLTSDGFPVWSVRDFEADDLIASAVNQALSTEDLTVLIVSSDKDLLQLVGPRVRAMSAINGAVFDEAAVGAKFGVLPAQIRDYLTLVGDASDNIAGAKDIGPKKAGALLAKFRTLDALYEQLEAKGAAAIGVKPAEAASLREFKASGTFETTRKLVTLRMDVEIPFEQITAERVAKDAESFGDFDLEPAGEGEDEPLPPVQAAPTAPAPMAPAETEQPAPAVATSIAVRGPSDIVLPDSAVQWERQLDPRSMKDARVLAQDMFQSRMFSAYGTPAGVLSTIMVGRELGLPAMASLRGVHVIEGRHALSAQLMVALILRSGMAEYFDPEEFDDTHAVFVTKRKGARKEIRLQHTIEMARTAGLLKTDSNWIKVPTDMCVARAQSRLARMVYPDIVGGIYTPEELRELREQAA